jgi:hypothetical protein
MKKLYFFLSLNRDVYAFRWTSATKISLGNDTR